MFAEKNISQNCILKCSKNIPKFQKVKFQKNIIGAHVRFSSFDKCNLYKNCKENLAFATRASHEFKKYCRRSNSETTDSQRLKIIEDTSNS